MSLNWLEIAKRGLDRAEVGLSEADVQRLIVEPVLQRVGFDTFDPDQVQEQFPVARISRRGAAGKADYALRWDGRVYAFVDAKALGKRCVALNTGTRTHNEAVTRLQTYCHGMSPAVRWAVITNGLSWIVYDCFNVRRAIHERAVLRCAGAAEFDLLELIHPRHAGTLMWLAEQASEGPHASSDSDAGRQVLAALRSRMAGTTARVDATPKSGVKATKPDDSVRPLTPDTIPPGRKLVGASLGGTKLAARGWIDLLVGVAEILSSEGRLPRELSPPGFGSPIISSEAAQLRNPFRLRGGGFLERSWDNRSAYVNAARHLVVAAGHPPDSLRIRLG